MGTVLLLIMVLGVVIFVANRISPPAKQAISSRRADASNPPVHKSVAGARPAAPASSSLHQTPSGVVRPPVLTADQRQALRDIRRQRAQERQHDSRMAAAAGLAGVVAGAALMHHHDAEATQAHIDQAAAMQRDALAQQAGDYDDGGADMDFDDTDWDDDTDDWHDDDDADWPEDDDEDYGSDSGQDDDYDDYGYGGSSDYGHDDYGYGDDDYSGGYDGNDGYHDYDGGGGYDGGDGGDGGDFF